MRTFRCCTCVCSLIVLVACGGGADPEPNPGADAGSGGDPDAGVSARVDAAPPVGLALCDGAMSPVAESGRLVVSPLRDIIPLCRGRVVAGDIADSSIVVLDVTGQELLRVALPSAPGDLELDRERGLLYATIPGQPSLVRLDLTTGATETISLPRQALSVALANGGHLFVSVPAEGGLYDVDVLYVDPDAGQIVATFETRWDPPQQWFEALLVFDRAGGSLISANLGLSPSTIRRHRFDAAQLAMEDAQERRDIGSNGQMLTISPDGQHVAYCVGSGNGNYDIYDFSSGDLDDVQGEWENGAYPRAAAFSSDSSRLVSTNGGMLKLWSVDTHALIDEWPAALDNCSYHSVRWVGIAPEGELLLGYSHCGFDEDTGQLVWQKTP